MTSAGSSHKNQLAQAFKITSRRNIIGAVIAFILCLFASLGIPAVITLDYISYNYNSGNIDATFETRNVLVIVAVICIVYNLFLAANLFREIYKKRSCDYYFSLPVKRGTLYAANVIFAFAVNIVCFACASAVAYAVITQFSSEKVSFYVDKAMYFAHSGASLVAVLCILSFLILCAVCAGKRVHYVILSVISLAGIHMISGSVKINLDSIWGLSIDAAKAYALSPIGSLNIISYCENTKTMAFLALVGAVEMLVVLLLGYAVFAKRKAEIAEVSLSGKTVEQAFLFILLLAAFSNATLNNLWGMIIVSIISSLIYCVIYNAVFFKKAFTKKSFITFLIACAVGTLFLVCAFIPSHDKYISYVPQEQEIESVTISGAGSDDYIRYFSDGLSYYGFSYTDSLELTSDEAIEKTVAFHKKLIDKETIEKSGGYVSKDFTDIFGYYNDTYPDCCCEITYTLKNGSRVSRNYYALAECVDEEFYQLAVTDEFLSSLEPFCENPDDILFVCVEDFLADDSFEEYDESVFYNQLLVEVSDYSEFFSVLKNDYKNSSKSDIFNEFSFDGYGFAYYDYAIENETRYYLDFYCISEEASEEQRERLKSMSAAELQRMYETYFNGYEENDAYYIDCYYLGVSNGQPNSVEYIENNLLK